MLQEQKEEVPKYILVGYVDYVDESGNILRSAKIAMERAHTKRQAQRLKKHFYKVFKEITVGYKNNEPIIKKILVPAPNLCYIDNKGVAIYEKVRQIAIQTVKQYYGVN